MKLQYTVVFERTPNNYCAYVPDLPGCIGTDRTWEGIQDQIRDAIAFHIEGLREDGETVPEPRMSVADAAAYHSDSAVPSAEWLETSELVAVVAVEAHVDAEPAVATDR
jgi:predicted RNase H-like HicB family nuclease